MTHVVIFLSNVSLGDMDKVYEKYIFVKYDTDREYNIHFCFFYDTARLQVYEKSTYKTLG